MRFNRSFVTGMSYGIFLGTFVFILGMSTTYLVIEATDWTQHREANPGVDDYTSTESSCLELVICVDPQYIEGDGLPYVILKSRPNITGTDDVLLLNKTYEYNGSGELIERLYYPVRFPHGTEVNYGLENILCTKKLTLPDGTTELLAKTMGLSDEANPVTNLIGKSQNTGRTVVLSRSAEMRKNSDNKTYHMTVFGNRTG